MSTKEITRNKRETIIMIFSHVVVGEVVQTHYYSNNASQTIRKEHKKSQRLHLTSNLCIFHCCCVASFKCLDRFLERSFKSSHAFEKTFKQPVNTFLYFLSNEICAVGWSRVPSFHLLLLCITLDWCGDDPSSLSFQIKINKNKKTPNSRGDW